MMNKFNLISLLGGSSIIKSSLSALFVICSYADSLLAQNSFPTASNTYVKIDGGGIDLLSPNRTGGWARGLTYFIHGQPNDRVLGLGMYGVGESADLFYLAYGTSPWQSRLGLYILPNGSIGIGTTAPQEKLSVNGNIRAREVKVEMGNWPDYVFKKGYDLMSLAELESYINTHGHLPGIPSAKDVEADGIGLAEMNRKLLEKVEELTLYILEQQREINQLKEKD
ncbi:hypothetical protein ACFOET_06715 [Parapedobacter deserti]|uniref:Tail fiber domain-containing protein n=1 Tax=Parapedobacter deserti TaxID=1912957 RepID=A0ABV7JGV1_9SPHI